MTSAEEPPTGELLGLSRLDLRALIAEVVERVERVATFADRLQALLQAVVAIGSQLELNQVLRTIVETAAELADAQYAALGVLDPSGESRLAEFITVGIDDDLRGQIGDLPHGRGVLGVLIQEPRAIRLKNLADHPASFGFPANHPPMRSFLGVPISVRGEAYGNLYLTEKHGGGEFTEGDEQVVLALASAAGLAVQNARLYEQAQQRQQWLEAASAITTRVLSGAAAASVLPDVVEYARTLSDADFGMLTLPTAGGDVRVEVADGEGMQALRGQLVGAHSLSAAVIRDGSAVVTDARVDDRVWPNFREAVDVGPVAYVPLGGPDEALGTLVVGRRSDRPGFADEVLRLVESFAGQAAVAVRLGNAAADRELVAVLGDRDRIARDLHDLVIQRLFATGMALEGAVRGITPAESADRVRRAIDDLDATIREIRTTIFALQSPAPAAGEGLRTAILQATRAATESLGFEPEVAFRGPVDTLVPSSIAEQLLAVLREALSNAARHAGASSVVVTVEADPDRVCLTVADDGKGLPPNGRRSGLANLTRRARDLNGSFDARPGEEGGTVVEWQVPTGG